MSYATVIVCPQVNMFIVLFLMCIVHNMNCDVSIKSEYTNDVP
ncbi:hypothetical protein FC826_06680 [Clostridium botulinum]|uniref:Uncharacterized protein n=1 Tax=Clostridium botulinum TaxID=1491 RepID=A0A6B4U2V8_CLOBO|nr:hypothetical protein [Clostridium botulinum]NFD78280.1 hypothetical protein [Clostridium botulinum]NFD83083.1 hypothetical protein [Clostridium botulinum]NFE07416.1 hypothetical protein [Clostridium botulinum]NFE33334.1 hypothetical protein [Clostridium botulinum]